jgi:exopolysaccharide biosynthesis polyprenyl glycosylphosphotransferase
MPLRGLVERLDPSGSAESLEGREQAHVDGPRRDRSLPLARRFLDGHGWVVVRVVADTLLLVQAVGAALIGAAAAGLSLQGARVLWLFVPITLALLALSGTYAGGIKPRMFQRVWQISGATSIAAMVVIVLDAFATASDQFPSLVGRAWFFSTMYVIGGRIVLTSVQRRARRERAVSAPTLIVGAGEVGAQVERKLIEMPGLGLRPIGFLDDNPDAAPVARRGAILGTPSELTRIVEETRADHVVFSFASAPDRALVPLLRACRAAGVQVSVIPRFFEEINVRTGIEHIGGLPLYGLRFVDPHGWKFGVKHALDRLVALVVLVPAAPVMLAAALAVKFTSPGPVLFRQLRVGRDGTEFSMLKFRTMAGDPERDGDANAAWAAAALGLAPDRPPPARTPTRVGGVLRRYSLDELPQLFNVLGGHMSLVGPRPEVPHFVRQFENEIFHYSDRHRVKPGVTGWAQVHDFRGATSLTDRVELDNYYIDNWSLALDLKIVLMTIGVLRRRPAESALG